MKIAVMGAGALGCYYGGRLLQAGRDVSFVARGAHLEALKREGLKIESPLGDAHLPEITATSVANPANAAPISATMNSKSVCTAEARYVCLTDRLLSGVARRRTSYTNNG